MRNRCLGMIQIALSLVVIIGLATGCVVLPATTESTIVGKWRHGLPEQYPPSMDPRMYEELKKLPENETYYLEFFKSGEVVWSGEEKIFAGTYRFIGDNYIEMTWDFMAGTLGEALVGKVYEIRISGDKMTLMPKGQWLSGTFRRVH